MIRRRNGAGNFGAADKKSFDALRKAHVADMARLMGRVALDLGGEASAQQPTDTRLKAVKQGTDDPQLCALYFQFGRYLLAASSRPGTQPANLQGIWNQDVVPAWGSKWTVNINTEMNYWPAEVCNLSECHTPLFDLMDDLAVTGAEVARKHYGARGWVVHHNADLWRGAAPVDGVWGIWPMASAWFSLHPWEHYQFSGDREFLQKRAWPLMKGAARFILDFLVEAPPGTPVAGRLVTNPSHSPENSFRKADGSQSMFTYGATMDLMIIHDLLTNCVRAIDVLDGGKGKFETELRRELTSALERLAPLQISKKDGRLQEWVEDYAEPEPGHRHMSHLFGLHPGSQITLRGTPELAAAARKSLDHRLANGGGGTGWSRAWVMNFFARFEDGAEAYKNLKLLLARSTLAQSVRYASALPDRRQFRRHRRHRRDAAPKPRRGIDLAAGVAGRMAVRISERPVRPRRVRGRSGLARGQTHRRNHPFATRQRLLGALRRQSRQPQNQETREDLVGRPVEHQIRRPSVGGLRVHERHNPGGCPREPIW